LSGLDVAPWFLQASYAAAHVVDLLLYSYRDYVVKTNNDDWTHPLSSKFF